MRKYIFILCLVSLLASCTGKKGNERKNIAVTIEPLRFFTEQIAGDRYEVMTIVQPGGNPETYEPTPRQMVELSKAAIYIKVGKIGFEQTWMGKLQENAPKMKVKDSSEGIEYIKDNNGIEDPHTWMSCRNARIISRNICNALIAENREDSTYFRENLKKLEEKITETENAVKKILEGKNTTFVIYHPILTYFARDYNLTQLPIEEEGREPSARQIHNLIVTAQQRKVRTVFVQKEFSPRNAMQITEATGAEAKDINPLSYNWAEEIRAIAEKLR